MEMNAQKGGRDKASKEIKNIYARGADDGLWMGLYLTAAFGVSVASLKVMALNVVALLMMIGVPVLTYVFLRRTHRAGHGLLQLSALWMQGITMFACASLIFGFASFVYLRWIDPGFLERVLTMGMEYYGQIDTDGARAVSDELRMVVDSGVMPAPSTIVMVWMWLTMFGGAVLSLLLSGVVKMIRLKNV